MKYYCATGGQSKANEECVPKHKLLVMDMQFNATKRWHERRLHPRGLEVMCSTVPVLPVYKRKRDPMECGSYRLIRLVEHVMNL